MRHDGPWKVMHGVAALVCACCVLLLPGCGSAKDGDAGDAVADATAGGAASASDSAVSADPLWSNKVASVDELAATSTMVVVAQRLTSEEAVLRRVPNGTGAVYGAAFEVRTVLLGSDVSTGEKIVVARMDPLAGSTGEVQAHGGFQAPFASGEDYVVGLQSGADYGAGVWVTIGGPSSVLALSDGRVAAPGDEHAHPLAQEASGWTIDELRTPLTATPETPVAGSR